MSATKYVAFPKISNAPLFLHRVVISVGVKTYQAVYFCTILEF